MVEVGQINLIEDKEYLKNYDLVDIPGVSEYTSQLIKKNLEEKILNKSNYNFEIPIDIDAPIPPKGIFNDMTIEKEMEKYNQLNEINYLTQIFSIIKSKMSNGIIVFSIDNYEHTENYRIIGKLQKILDKPIENFLILLNKIDKSPNSDYDLKNLERKCTEYFPNYKFNFINNTIVPCSAIQLETKLKMDKSFKHLLYYYYLNLLIKINLNTTSNPSVASINITFLEIIKKAINNISKAISKIKFIQKIEDLLKDKNLLIILDEIKEIFKFIKENHKENKINLGINEQEFNIEEIKKTLKEIEDKNENESEKRKIVIMIYLKSLL